MNNNESDLQSKTVRHILSGFILCTLLPIEAVAQNILEEVTVTARKREESMQEVPVALLSLSSDDLTRKKIIDIESLETNAPSFTFDYLSGTRARTTIRGIGSDTTGAGGDPSTGVFLDGVYQGRQGMQAVDMYDIRQIDVLKGPQGTLWGKNVAGGAISIVTAKPENEFGARIGATYGRFNQAEIEGMLNVPLSDTTLSRVAFSYRRSDGYVRNLTTGNDVGDTDRFSMRSHLSFEPSENIDMLFSLDYTTDDASGLPVTTTRSDTVAAEPAVDNNFFETEASIDGFSKRDMWGFRGELNYDFGFATYTSIVGYRDLAGDTREDWDGTNSTNFPTVFQFGFGWDEDATALSFENRLAGQTQNGTDWVVGLYYLSEDTTTDIDFALGDSFDAPLFVEWNSESEAESIALFSEITFPVTDRLSITGGVRYSDESKDASLVRLGSGAFDTGPVSNSTNKVTWRANIDYKLSEDKYLYAIASTGFKSGIFSGNPGSLEQASTPLKPEEVDNYEVGIKSDWLDKRFRANINVFYFEYENLQLVQFTGLASGGAVSLPAADALGVETEFTYLVGDNLSIDLNYAYLDSSAENIENGELVTGRELVRSAKNNLSLSGVYIIPLSSGGDLELFAQYNYRSRMFDDPDNNLLELRPSRTLVDLGATWIASNDAWRVSLWGKNLTDEEYPIRIANVAGFNQIVPGPRARYGITISREFQ